MIVAVAIVVLVIALLVPPIPQDPIGVAPVSWRVTDLGEHRAEDTEILGSAVPCPGHEKSRKMG